MDHLLSKEKVQGVMSEDLSVRFWKSDLPPEGAIPKDIRMDL